MTWNENDWNRLATLFDGWSGAIKRDGSPVLAAGGTFPRYPGYRPEVAEAPNGDTRECPACPDSDGTDGAPYGTCATCGGLGRVPNVDAQKRYLHVAEKYLRACPGLEWPREYLARAHYEACRVAEALNVPAAYYPRAEFGALRVLDYPPGAGTVEHTDFDLLTVNLWRSTPNDHEAYFTSHPQHQATWVTGAQPYHIGEIGELVGLGPATPHRVPARPYAQQSIVYFAIPDHGAIIPGTQGKRKCSNCRGSGIVASQVEYATDSCYCAGGFAPMNVGEWLAERMARSRVATAGAAGGYK